MLAPLNQRTGRTLASFILVFGLTLAFPPFAASAGNDNKSCQPTAPYDLSPSEFEELREELWETGNVRDLELSFEIEFEFVNYPFFLLLMAAKQIDQNKLLGALMSLEGLEGLSHKLNYCQDVFVSEITSILRFTAVKHLAPKDAPYSEAWNAFGHGVLRYFALNDYGAAKCIIENVGVEVLKLDREPTFEEYPRRCVVR